MPTLRLNSNLAGFPVGSTNYVGCAGSTGSIANSTLADSALFGSAVSGTASLYIFKGTVPTDFTTFTCINDRSADLLVTLPVIGVTEVTYSSPTTKRYLIMTTASSVNATGTGTATWFCLTRTNSSFTTSSLFTGFGAMIGTVGLNGSSEDLQIADNNISTGNPCSCTGLYINFPFSWTF